MSTTTKNCDECAHFNPDVLYDECPCDKEHRARFYKPRGPLDTDYGWKRKCADFREKTPTQTSRYTWSRQRLEGKA